MAGLVGVRKPGHAPGAAGVITGRRKFTLGLVAVVLTLAFAAWAPGITETVRLAALDLVGLEFAVTIGGHVAADIVKRPARGRQTEASTK